MNGFVDQTPLVESGVCIAEVVFQNVPDQGVIEEAGGGAKTG